MRSIISVIPSLLIALPIAFMCTTAQSKSKECLSAREYITSLEYLRDKKVLGLSENQAQELAGQVSKGCTGAAKRFTRAVETLMKFEASSKEAVLLAVDLAQKEDAYTNAFIGIFARSYSRDHLDLDFRTSLEIAKSLSVDYKGDAKIALKDFISLVDFCSSDRYVSFSKPHCGVFANRILKNTENFNTSVAKSFKETYEFIVKEVSPGGSPGQALDMAEKIVSISPESHKNFMTAYKYGTSDKGLGLDMKRSVDFAMGISEKSRFSPDRLPASN